MEVCAPDETLQNKIEALRAEQQAIKLKKRETAKALRNVERKKTRLRQKARQLTDDDLVAVLMMRKDYRDARAGGSGEMSGGASGTQAQCGATDTHAAPPSGGSRDPIENDVGSITEKGVCMP